MVSMLIVFVRVDHGATMMKYEAIHSQVKLLSYGNLASHYCCLGRHDMNQAL